MIRVDRRDFFLASAGLSLTGVVPLTGPSPAPAAAAAATDATRHLAKYVVSAKAADVPGPVHAPHPQRRRRPRREDRRRQTGGAGTDDDEIDVVGARRRRASGFGLQAWMAHGPDKRTI